MWDTTCADSTIASDSAVARPLLEWVERNGRKIVNDGRPTFMSRSKKGSAPGRVITTPDVTIAPAGNFGTKWTELLDWGSDHMAIVTEFCAGGLLQNDDAGRPKWRLKNTFLRRLHEVRRGGAQEALRG